MKAILIALTLGIWANALIPMWKPITVKAAKETFCTGSLTPMPTHTGYLMQFTCQ